MDTDPGCIFCKIIAGELPSARIHEDERTVAFMDIAPATEGHALVVPRSHPRDLGAIDPDDLAAVARTGQVLARRMRDVLGADGVNLLNAWGEAAWQTVFHFHLHVIPRYAGDPQRDAMTLPWEPAQGDPDAIAAVGARLRG